MQHYHIVDDNDDGDHLYAGSDVVDDFDHDEDGIDHDIDDDADADYDDYNDANDDSNDKQVNVAQVLNKQRRSRVHQVRMER